MNEGRLQLRKKEFKKTFDEPLQWRDESASQLRKENRLGHLNKRRNKVENTSSTNEEHVELEPEAIAKMIPQWISDLNSTRAEETRYEAITQLRKALCRELKPILDDVLRYNGIPAITATLRSPNRDIQFEAAWALTNVASSTTLYTQAVINSGAVPELCKLLDEGDAGVAEQVMWAFGNISGDSVEARDLVLSHGILDILLKAVDKYSKNPFLRTSTWAVGNLVRGQPCPSLELCNKALTILNKAMTFPDGQLITEACWALSYIAHPDNGYVATKGNSQFDRISILIEKGFSHRVVQLMGSSNDNVKYAALRCSGAVVTGSDVHTQVMIDAKCIPMFKCFIGARNAKAMQKEAAWALSNICAGTREQVQAVANEGVFELLIELYKSSDIELKMEVGWCLSNSFLSGNIHVVNKLLNLNALAPMCEALDVDETGNCKMPERLISIVLSSIDGILKMGTKKDPELADSYIATLEPICFSRLEVLSGLLNPEYENIRAKSRNIIESYLPVDMSDCEENMDDWNGY